MKLNNCPLRRISPCFVIATKTQLDVSSLNLPEHLTDDYFKRAKKPRKVGKKDDGDIFAQPDKVGRFHSDPFVIRSYYGSAESASRKNE